MQLIKKTLLLILLTGLAACSGEGSDSSINVEETQEAAFEPIRLELYINSELMIADGTSELKMHAVAYDSQGNTKTNLSGASVFINDIEQPEFTFSTSDIGEYHIYAKHGDIETQSYVVTALEPKEYPTVEIPIIFHIGEYEGEDYSHIDQAYVQELIDILNNGFSNRYSSRNLNAVDTGIRFRLASVDPDGQNLVEKGIHRFDAKPYDDGGAHYSPHGEIYNTPNNTKFGTFEVYRMSNDQHWPQHLYKNVYIAPSEDANWAVFYQLKDDSTVQLSGVEQGVEYFEDGSLYTDILLINPHKFPSNVIVHEMGHSFGLFHPESYDGCLSADFVVDTLSIDYNGHEHICENDSQGQRFIDNPSKLHLDNFMHGANHWGTTPFIKEYNNFTYGQRERIRLIVSEGKYVSELINSNR